MVQLVFISNYSLHFVLISVSILPLGFTLCINMTLPGMYIGHFCSTKHHSNSSQEQLNTITLTGCTTKTILMVVISDKTPYHELKVKDLELVLVILKYQDCNVMQICHIL